MSPSERQSTKESGNARFPAGTDRATREIFRLVAGISPALRVLVVDDESLIRWAVSETLREAGCTVVDARDGESAMQALTSATEPFDVILLDYQLPDSRDLALLAVIRSLRPQSHVVMMSAHATADVVDDARRLGADRVLHKPFEMGDVIRVVLQAYFNRPR